jgi:hypothetical protein
LEGALPIFLHEGSIAIDHCIETGLIYLEEVFSNSCGVYTIKTHDAFRQIGEGLMVCFPADSAETEGKMHLFR